MPRVVARGLGALESRVRGDPERVLQGAPEDRMGNQDPVRPCARSPGGPRTDADRARELGPAGTRLRPGPPARCFQRSGSIGGEVVPFEWNHRRVGSRRKASAEGSADHVEESAPGAPPTPYWAGCSISGSSPAANESMSSVYSGSPRV